MKPSRSIFVKVKTSFTPIEITIGPVLMDVGEMHNPPIRGGDLQVIKSLVVANNGSSVFLLIDRFAVLREEIESNLLLPINLVDKSSYLQEILDFYTELEGKISEDEQGYLSTDIVKFTDMTLDEMTDFHKDEYSQFLKSLKEGLRKEIIYLIKQLNQVEMKRNIPIQNDQKVNSDIKWKIDKGDLIELVKALCLIGAINNSTNNLSETEAYNQFGKFLGVDLKRPSDLIKNKSKYQDKEFLLEKLHGAFQDHLKHIRNSK